MQYAFKSKLFAVEQVFATSSEVALAHPVDSSLSTRHFSYFAMFLLSFSYNQFLEFSLRIGESQGRPSQRDVILEGNGRSVYLPIFAQNNTMPGIRTQNYTFRLVSICHISVDSWLISIVHLRASYQSCKLCKQVFLRLCCSLAF